MTFYNRIINLCDKTGIKLTPLLKKLNLATSATARWKNGVIPSGETLLILSDYFNVSIDYLLCKTDIPAINTNEPVSVESLELQKIIKELSPEKIKALIETAKAMK